MRTVYLAGPMRGYERFNFDAFESAQSALTAQGLDVISPHQMDLDMGFDPSKSLDFNNFSLEDAVRRDIEAIIVSDGIVLLPGWEQSKGARAERAVAEWLGKDVELYGTITSRV